MRRALVLVFFAVTPGWAMAGMTMHNDSGMASVACDNILNDSSRLMTLAASDPNGDTPKALKALGDDEKLCRYPNRINAGDGYAAFAQASELHRAADPAWKSMLDMAIAKLTRCRSDYPKAKIGSDCGAAVETATNRKTEWTTETPQATASP